MDQLRQSFSVTLPEKSDPIISAPAKAEKRSVSRPTILSSAELIPVDGPVQDKNPSVMPTPSWMEKIKQSLSLRKPKKSAITVPEPLPENTPAEVTPEVVKEKGSRLANAGKKIFLRSFFPFAIPSAFLLLIAVLAIFPPLHQSLGPATPSLASIFAGGLALIITVTGLIFGLFLVKKSRVFRGKTRRIAYAGVAAGISLLFISGVVCASVAPGIFGTVGQPPAQNTTDRMAKLAALEADANKADAAAQPVAAIVTVVPTVTSSSGVTIPVKDALSIGESYQYGDATRISTATIYDYKVLPFYFWWFIDYNRFVQAVPEPGYSYLVVFMRIENKGTQSALVPSADKIVVSSNGNTTDHLPFFNMSVLSEYQRNYYSTHYDKLPYQWIRELGQDKRDYAFLTGYNIFGGWSFVSTNATVTDENSTSTDSSVSSSATNGQGFFIKPGPGNAIDGYLVYEVPDAVVNNGLDTTYVNIAFNANSGTRWQL